MSDKGMNGKKTTSKRGAVIGGAVAGVVSASGLLVFLIHRQCHLRKMRTGQQTVVEPLMLPPSNTIKQPESAGAQYAEDQALAGQIPAVPVLHSASSLLFATNALRLNNSFSDVLSFLNYPQSMDALREKERRVSDNPSQGADSEIIPGAPAAIGVPQAYDTNRFQGDDSAALRREVEELRRQLALMRHAREAAPEAPPLYDDP